MSNPAIAIQALTLEERVKTKCSHRAVIDYTDLIAFAATSGVLNLFPLLAGDIVDYAFLDLPKVFLGGAISAIVVKLGYTGTDAGFLANKNIFTGGVVADGTFVGAVAHQAATTLIATFTSTTANLAALTQGKVFLYFNVIRTTDSALRPLSAP